LQLIFRLDFKSNFSKENSAELPLNQTLRLSHPIATNINMITEEDEEIVPRETLNSIYGENYDLIKIKIMDTENEAINYLTDNISKLQVKYKEFNTDINSHFRNLTSKIADAFKLNNSSSEEIKGTKKEKKENLMKKYSSEYIQELEKIINIHEQIFNNIKNTISIFYDFLDISKLSLLSFLTTFILEGPIFVFEAVSYELLSGSELNSLCFISKF